MSDTTEAQDTQADAAEGVEATETVETEPAQDGTDWKAEARKWESRAKENKTAADERDEHAARVAALEAEVEGFRAAEQIRKDTAEVAKEHGVNPDLLRGSTRDELDAHAQKVKAELDAHVQELKAALDARPAPPVISSQGKSPGSTPADPNREAVRKLFRGEDL